MAMSDKDMMAMLKQDAKAANAEDTPTPPPSEQGMSTAPMASPMSTPEPQKGVQEQARLNVMMALDMLQQAMTAFGPDSDEGKAIADIVTKITAKFGERESETRQLIPAEIMQLIQTLPQAGGATPGQREAASAPIAGMNQPPLPI